MTARSPRYSKEEFARRGDDIYESRVRSQVEANNHDKIVAIDIRPPAKVFAYPFTINHLEDY